MNSLEKSTARTYDRIAKVYSEYRRRHKLFWNEYLEMPATLSFLKNIKGKRVLDLGAGPGVYAQIFRKKGAKVSGIDISSHMVKIAQENVADVDFRVGSAYKMPYESESFDIVVAAYVVEYFERLDKAFKEVYRVLKKGGVFIFSIGNPVTATTHSIKWKGKWLKKRYRAFDDYWKEGRQTVTWGTDALYSTKMTYMHRTYQTYIKAIIKNGFAIEDYLDARPIAAGKKKDKREYEYLSIVPEVCVFKVRKL